MTVISQTMPFLDFFRKFFDLHRSQTEPSQHRYGENQNYEDSFRNPIWTNDEDDVNDFSQSTPNYTVFSDPFQITRFFESQIDELLTNFFGFDGFGNRFPNSFDNNHFSNALPPSCEQKVERGPRDEVLKPDSKTKDGISVSFGTNTTQKPCDSVLKPTFEMPDPYKKKLDSDIDGKIKSNDLAKIWKLPPFQELEEYSPSINIHSFGSSVSTQIFRRADGSIEERRIIRDSGGNEEIKVTRRIDDEIHSIITKKSKDGFETKTEDIIKIDKQKIKGLDEKFIIHEESQADSFPWHKFFGPSPKL